MVPQFVAPLTVLCRLAYVFEEVGEHAHKQSGEEEDAKQGDDETEEVVMSRNAAEAARVEEDRHHRLPFYLGIVINKIGHDESHAKTQGRHAHEPHQLHAVAFCQQLVYLTFYCHDANVFVDNVQK